MHSVLALALAYGFGLTLGLAWPGLVGQRVLALAGLGLASAGAFAHQCAMPARAQA